MHQRMQHVLVGAHREEMRFDPVAGPEPLHVAAQGQLVVDQLVVDQLGGREHAHAGGNEARGNGQFFRVHSFVIDCFYKA